MSRQSRYIVALFVAAAFEIVCPISERSYDLETLSETLAVLCIAASLVFVCLAGMWIRSARVTDLVSAGFLTIAVPFADALLLWLFQVQVNVHGVSMGASLFHGFFSLLAALLLFIAAGVKHIRAVN